MSFPDVAVAGGGLIGCSIAWELARRGLSVSIHEAGALGGEASWAGAGMLAPGGEVEADSPWGRRSLESLRLYPEFVRDLADESGSPIDYRACGAIEVAYDANELQAGLERARSQGALGIGSAELDARAALELVPLLNAGRLAGAVHYPEDAIVDPRQVVRSLREACIRRAVRIEEWSAVKSIAEVRAGAVVLAAGAWSGELVPGIPRSFPVKGHLVGYHLPANSIGPIIRRGHTYVLQRGTGLTIAGSTMERIGFDRTVDPAAVASIHARAHDLLPALLKGSPDESWIGFRPGVDAEEPQVGRFQDSNLWLAYGHYRNGILLAPITARIIADGITSS